jgi:hypothetical protein
MSRLQRSTANGSLPGPMAQAFTPRAFGAENLSFHTSLVSLGWNWRKRAADELENTFGVRI